MKSLVVVSLALTLYAVSAQFVNENIGAGARKQVVGKEFNDDAIRGQGQSGLQSQTQLGVGERTNEQVQAFDKGRLNAGSGKRAGEKAQIAAVGNIKAQDFHDVGKVSNVDFAIQDQGRSKQAFQLVDDHENNVGFKLQANDAFKENAGAQVLANQGVDANEAQTFGFYDNLNFFNQAGLQGGFQGDGFLNFGDQFNKFGKEQVAAKSNGGFMLGLDDSQFFGKGFDAGLFRKRRRRR